jgi:tRNA A37 threonylcarbamoyladenosine synthetase subunit TsaC/SUA5/YrdC
VLGSSLILPGDDQPLSDPDEIASRLARRIDLVIGGSPGGLEPTTVIDLTGDSPSVIRVGCGPIDRMTG